MSWGAQTRSKDAKTPSVGLAMSENPEPDSCPVQPCALLASLVWATAIAVAVSDGVVHISVPTWDHAAPQHPLQLRRSARPTTCRSA
jgi:hypothetical protein